jgi:glutathione synthase/RimK-type ligase-like ATP-grasp enzyme
LSIAITYEYPETDELGIKLTAEEMGIDLVYIPFRKVSIFIDSYTFSYNSRVTDYRKTIENVNAVLNRMQSKNRRLYAASLFEALGKYVLNPLQVETLCFSKFRSLVEFWKNGIRIPETVFVPCDPHDITRGGITLHNEEIIADLIQNALKKGSIVLKPDGGTHGQGVKLAKDRDTLIKFLETSTPSIVNPTGFVAQEFIEKWFYDLRIIVTKERGKTPYCYPKALGRASFKDFRTNTFLGNMVFEVKLPQEVRETSIKCGAAVGKDCEAWILALDAMLNVGKDRFVGDDYIKSELEKLAPYFETAQKIKREEKLKNRDFKRWSKKVENAYQNYKDTEHYTHVREIIEESVERGKNEIMFHEANACPDFWEQTRTIAGINVAVPLLKCAKSVEGWSIYQQVK